MADRLDGRGGPVRVEAAALAAVAGRPGRHDPGEERVAVAIEGEVHESEDVAARLALAPQGLPRTREEVDVTRRERRRDRLRVGPGEHEDPPVDRILHDHGHETVPPVAERTVVAQGTGGGGERVAAHAADLRDGPDRDAGGGHRRLDRGDGVQAAVEDGGGEDRRCAALDDGGHEVRRPGGAPGGHTGTGTRSAIARSSAVSKPAWCRRGRSR